CSSSRKQSQNGHDKLYRGIRMRKWGKWVAEIREPNKRSTIWLGSYSSPVAAARAYHTAVFYLRGPTARLNFPECIVKDDVDQPHGLSAAFIKKKATDVGARVDAALHASTFESNSIQFYEHSDLNEYPSPEISEDN
ncbi:ethylene-responsive transcription factor ERF011-like, partial [Olea europaea var. sylvestris]|uniref:ethylene-responsive transcription factor ERF011-like n=1 Tax=Olea europaea var. sylvestris TaxID=158386 RepID=UPI000C1D2DC2